MNTKDVVNAYTDGEMGFYKALDMLEDFKKRGDKDAVLAIRLIKDGKILPSRSGLTARKVLELFRRKKMHVDEAIRELNWLESKGDPEAAGVLLVIQWRCLHREHSNGNEKGHSRSSTGASVPVAEFVERQVRGEAA